MLIDPLLTTYLSDSESRSGATLACESGAAGRIRIDPCEGAGEGSRVALPECGRASRRLEAVEAEAKSDRTHLSDLYLVDGLK